MTPLAKSGPEQCFHFAGTQDGERFFRGVCAEVRQDGHRIELCRRRLDLYSFEPGDAQPRRTEVSLESLTLKLRDFNVLVSEGPAPAGLEMKP
jgi:hypothetical protein